MIVTTWVKSTTQKTLRPIDTLKTDIYLHRGPSNPESHVTVISKFCAVMPNIFVLNVEFALLDPSDDLEFLGGL
jgi:hypothetical protein